MGTINVRIKIMPSSPNSNLEDIKEEARKTIEREGGKGCIFGEEPIAFGLKAVIVTFLYPEEKGIDSMENHLGKIENVNSVQVVDIRRAFG